jgi:sterol desaturase/sphingolipid hydroxylase (fatty acid hydroxylase superfamily)
MRSVLADDHWVLSLITGILIIAVTMIMNRLMARVATFRNAKRLNKEVFARKMERPAYSAVQMRNRKWAGIYLLVIFALILPFCLTAAPQPWWRIPRDVVVILMVYDFLYYFTHRYLFHDNGFMGGPLLQMHAVHHRQHNPCRGDASYLHPLEIAIGLGLYVATIFMLSRFMGNFQVATIVITWVAYTEVNLVNHDLWNAEHFPFKYFHTASKLHHFHHVRFTGGNFATLSPLYDWMFGTLDRGKGYRAEMKGLQPKAGKP